MGRLGQQAIAARSRVDARARRADAGAVTELARALLRDAREDGAGRRARTRPAACDPRPRRIGERSGRRRPQPLAPGSPGPLAAQGA